MNDIEKFKEFENKMFSDDYLKWVKETNQKNLTNTQHEFAEWLIQNRDKISKIGDLETIFKSVRGWLKK